MSRQEQNDRHIIWSDLNLDLDDWRESLEELYPDYPEDELYDIMVKSNVENLYDERVNLDIQLSQPIIVIGDLGRWNGRVSGYKMIDSGNIKDCLYSDTDYTEWYVDKYGDLRADAVHHDGTNHYLYRVFKDGVTDTQIENLQDKIYNGKATRADFGSAGNEFWTTWNDFRKDLKTDEFKAEFDDVINGLRDGDVLSGRKAMSSYCYSTPDSSFNDDRNHYGIRLDTEKYSYLMRFNPNRGEYNLYCYCYQKEWINAHLKNAERGIRFIDPHYQEQFRIADGEKISIKLGDGKTMERTCRYIDDYHLEVGTNLYHICEFAELCERNGHTVEPAAKENTKPAKDKEKSR